ncbi:decarboxylase [Okeania sp. SIO2B3]|uniref:diaminopimelate decarboxylase family protein n=1 Tax=Okeania sp. SIO2B3 TaxID=2607784 RepID=UPI0013BF9D75|nr:decarboxylase [Okeania sp. SIO2B3]NET44791.1 decarboxylase [Okeania sp. SIO2B3]
MTPFSLKFAQELLENYGSPLYVYDSEILIKTINHITESIPYPHTEFHFASVTNGNVSLLKIFREYKWGLHANTPGDVFLGLKAGFSPDKIVYSGSNLNAQEFSQLLNWGVTTFNLDSVSQLQLFCDIYIDKFAREITPKLGLRLNLPELTGESRIGVRPEEFSQAIQITKSVGLKLSGLHFYRGTGTNATKAFTQVIEPILTTGKFLPDWEYLDFGGGFGYPYHHNGIAFDWQTFGVELTAAIEKVGRKIKLIIEPGRAAIAGSSQILTKVISVKWQGDKQIVGVDTTVANLSVPSVHGGYREIVSFREINKSDLYLTDVCGNTTYSRDYLGKNCQLPPLEKGDILAILDTGAYGYAMSSHFLHRPRPAEVLLEKSQHRLIRQREDYNILLNGQIFS